MTRIDALRKIAFQNDKLDGFVVFDSTNLTWLTDFSGANALLIPKNGEISVYVYGVNYSHAKSELSGFDIELVKFGEDLMSKIAKKSSALGIEKLAADSLDMKQWRALLKLLGNQKKLKLESGYLRDLRKIKDEREVEFLRKAGEITNEGMGVAQEVVAPGLKEYEVAAEIEYAMRKLGSSGTAFETIVASGFYSAFPHGGCSDRIIQKGDLVVVDAGATYKKYHSDMTRTFVAGKPTEKQKKLHEIVLNSQKNAIRFLKPGIKAKSVDAVARGIIDKAGYGENFVHSLGHGVGLEVHESPILGPNSEELLSVGNVVTVEPGIYLVGYGGIRIEDTVLVQNKGAEKITNGHYSIDGK